MLGVIGALLSAVVLALWKHKKSGTGQLHIVGAVGLVESKLDPEGSVLISNELWRARSFDGIEIASKLRVRVVALQGHLLIVRRDM